jgi:hypothetical protein
VWLCLVLSVEIVEKHLQLFNTHVIKTEAARTNTKDFLVGVPDGVHELITLEVFHRVDADAVPVADVADILAHKAVGRIFIDPSLSFGVEGGDVVG